MALLGSFALSSSVPLSGHPLSAVPENPGGSAFLVQRTPVLGRARVSVDTSDSLEAQLATITTDTGDYFRGHKDFRNYTKIGLCFGAVETTRAVWLRTLKVQALPDSIRDTVGLAATAPVARACGRRFTLATTKSSDYFGLFEFALYEQNDSLAQAAALAYFREKNYKYGEKEFFDHERGVYDVFTEALEFGNRAVADSVLARVIALYPANTLAQASLYATYATSMLYHRTQDTAQFLSAYRRSIQLIESTPASRTKHSQWAFEMLHSLSWHLGMFLARQWAPPESLAVLAKLVKKYDDQMDDTVRQRLLEEGHEEATKNRTIEDFLYGYEPIAPNWYAFHILHTGAAAPRLQADYWVPAPGRSSDDTVRPVRGKVNVICNVLAPVYIYQGEHGQNLSATLQADSIQRWLRQYGAGLDVTLVRSASGYDLYNTDGNGIVSQVELLFPGNTAEAHAWGWYAHDYRQLPVTLAVQVKQEQWLPSPDGRRLQRPYTQFDEFFRADTKTSDQSVNQMTIDAPERCAVIDHDGTIVSVAVTNEVGKILDHLFHGFKLSDGASPR